MFMVCSEVVHVPCNTGERFVYPNAAADQGSSWDGGVSSQQGWQIYSWQCDQSHWWQRLSRAGRGRGSLHVLLQDTHKSQNACIVIKAVCWTFLFFSCARLHPRTLGKHVVLIKCFSIAQQQSLTVEVCGNKQRLPKCSWLTKPKYCQAGSQLTYQPSALPALEMWRCHLLPISLRCCFCSLVSWCPAWEWCQMLAAAGKSRGCRRSIRASLCNHGMSAWFLEENHVWSFKDTGLSFILMWNIWLRLKLRTTVQSRNTEPWWWLWSLVANKKLQQPIWIFRCLLLSSNFVIGCYSWID